MKRYEIAGAAYEDELTEDDSGPLMFHADHAAFVERVREIAEKLIHGEPNNSTDGPDCTCQCCIRKQLLEVLNG